MTWIIGTVADKFLNRPIFVVAGVLPLAALLAAQLLIPKLQPLNGAS
ncbi:MAG: hypothetical protein HUU20_13740 [Pirellulales bacterium]|nr:hypothetical protein [Pirellulales bacterium]